MNILLKVSLLIAILFMALPILSSQASDRFDTRGYETGLELNFYWVCPYLNFSPYVVKHKDRLRDRYIYNRYNMYGNKKYRRMYRRRNRRIERYDYDNHRHHRRYYSDRHNR